MTTEPIEITKQDILNANTYIPIAEKARLADAISKECLETVSVSVEGSDAQERIPGRGKVNQSVRSRYLMGIFVKLYLGKDFETESEDDESGTGLLISEAEYDRYAGSHVFNQFQRMKIDNECKDTVYGMLHDYGDLTSWIDASIKDLKHAINDTLERAMSYLNTAVTPQSMEAAMMAMTESKDELEAYASEKVAEMEARKQQEQTQEKRGE